MKAVALTAASVTIASRTGCAAPMDANVASTDAQEMEMAVNLTGSLTARRSSNRCASARAWLRTGTR